MARFSRIIIEQPRKRILYIIIIVAVALRLGATLLIGNGGWYLPGIFDQISYHSLAVRVISGLGFTFDQAWWPSTPAGEPTAHWSYLYTSYLAAVYWLFGAHPVVARVIQAVLVGVLQPYLTYRIGYLVFSRKVGLVAAGLTAIYAYFIYYAAALMTESFYITAVLGSVYLTLRLAKTDEQNWKLAVGLGLTLGAAVLLRQVFLLMIPLLVAWIWWARIKRARELSIRSTLLVGLVLAAMILPFTAYNYTRFGQLVLLNTNAGFAFFWANHPIYGTRFEPILRDNEGGYPGLIPQELRDLDEATLERELFRRGLGFVLADPVRYIQLSLSRIPAYFMFWPSSESSVLSNVARVGSFGLLLPLILAGLALSIIRIPTDPRGPLSSQSVLLLMFVLLYSLVHILSWALIRYRLPVDALLVIFAGLATVEISERLPLRKPMPSDFAAGKGASGWW